MKFSVLQDNLAKGINTVTRAIPTKAALPILSNILISAEDDRLKLAATNMDTTIITHVNASVQKEGAITVPAKLIKDIITNLSPGTVKAALKNDILQLESENSKSIPESLDFAFHQPPDVSGSHVTVCDINQPMLEVGRDKALGLGYTSGKTV